MNVHIVVAYLLGVLSGLLLGLRAAVKSHLGED